MNNPPNRTLRDYAGVSLRGFLMGMADVIPGVSGGTMAFILGIYDELIDAIRAVLPLLRNIFSLRWREAFEQFPWRFLLALGLGIGAAILSLAKFLEWALEEYPVFVYSVFFGLIVASVYVVRRRVRQWNLPPLLMVALFAIGAYLLVGLRPTETPNALWFIFLSGMIAICAMILPGISGAFILVLLGKYKYILSALNNLDIVTVLVFMAGAAVGIVSFANILRWLLDRYHDLTVAALVGFMLGSLRVLWPWKTDTANVLPAAFTGEVALALGLMLFGFAVVILIEMAAERRKTA
jgi:putative membrane protein